jgi:hypothetical protein
MLEWHFEGRHRRNETPTAPPEELDASWILLPEALSVYHQDPDTEVELKYVRKDENSFLELGSHEAVWDPNDAVWLEEGAFGSTYNYVNPGGVFRSFGHFACDVVPYWFWGTDRGVKHKSFRKRVTGK